MRIMARGSIAFCTSYSLYAELEQCEPHPTLEACCNGKIVGRHGMIINNEGNYDRHS